MPSASRRNRRLRPLPHSTVFASSSLRMIMKCPFCFLLTELLLDLSQVHQQSAKVFDHVASLGSRIRHAGYAGAADDRGVGTDRPEVVDVALVLDPEADRD